MKINKNIFREYDIRGIVKDDFKDEVVDSLGKSFGSYVKEFGGLNIAVSGDIRDTTIPLKKIFIKGILSTGINVIDIGILPTPVNYYSFYILDIDASVQITGSHNPPEFNGFKLSMHKKPVYGEQIQLLKKFIDDVDFDFDQITIRERKRRKDRSGTSRLVPLHANLRPVMKKWFATHPGGRFTIECPQQMPRRKLRTEWTGVI